MAEATAVETPELRAAVPFGVRGGVTVELPEPDRLAELLAEPGHKGSAAPTKPRAYTPPLGRAWEQPALFDPAVA